MTLELPADDDHGVFCGTTSQLTPAALVHAVRSGRLIRVRRNIYVSASRYAAEDMSPAAARERLRIHSVAAVAALTESVASHRSAAALAGAPLWSWRSASPCVTVGQGRDSGGTNNHVHRARLAPEHIVDGAVRRTTISRTILDLAREHGVPDAVVAGDFALREGWTSVDTLRATAGDCGRFPGIRRACRIIELLDPRMESPLESVSRLVLRSMRFPEPVPQVNIYDCDGQFLGRVDNYWDELGIAGEIDGREKYQDHEDVWSEKRRQDRLSDTNLVIARWGMPEIRNPARLQAKLHSAMQRAARQRTRGRDWTAVPAYPQPPWAA